MNKVFLSSVLFLVVSIQGVIKAQDETPSARFGFKLGAERGSWLRVQNVPFQIYHIGIQYIQNVGTGNMSVETGLYQTSKTLSDPLTDRLAYRYLTLPVNLRTDINGLYISGGVFAEYLFAVNLGQSAYNPLSTSNRLGSGLNLAGGYEKLVSDEWAFFIEARAMRTLSAGGRPYFLSYGLAIGMNMRF
jgi:hypothetical protein